MLSSIPCKGHTNSAYYDSDIHESASITDDLPAFDTLCVLIYLISKLDRNAPNFADNVQDVLKSFATIIYNGGRPIDTFRAEPAGSPLHIAYVLGLSPSNIEYHLHSLDVDGPTFLAWIALEFAKNLV